MPSSLKPSRVGYLFPQPSAFGLYLSPAASRNAAHPRPKAPGLIPGHREIIFHSAGLPGNAALRACASLFSGRNREADGPFEECARCRSDTARTDPACRCLGLLYPCCPVRHLRSPTTVCARPFHSSATAAVSPQSAWSAVDDGRSWPVDRLEVAA